MKKVVFIIPKLGGGGAERVVTTIMNHIDKRRFKVYLILVNDNGEYLKQLSDKVNVTILPVNRVRFSAISIIKEMHRIKPDIIFSTIRGVSFLLALIKPFFPQKSKLVVREMNTPSASLKYSKFKPLLKLSYKTVFKNADKIVCQSEYMKNDFISLFNYSESKLIHIYNPIDIEHIEAEAYNTPAPFPKDDKQYNVISVGRLGYQKNYESLIDSLVIAKDKNLNIKVWVLGEGPLYTDLCKRADQKGVNKMIEFVGRQENPYQWMYHADLLLLHSRYEGLPNVLLESLALDCPAVVTEHPGGTKEIMDIAGLENNIVETLNWNQSWFNTNENDFKDRIHQEFNVNKIIKEYENVLMNV